jgi:antitoxin MazE
MTWSLSWRLNMQTKIKKWGNSLALRIPKSFALNANLKQDELVDISVDKERIIIIPLGKKEYSLDDLLAGVSEENLHGEFDTGVPVGKEIW